MGSQIGCACLSLWGIAPKYLTGGLKFSPEAPMLEDSCSLAVV